MNGDWLGAALMLLGWWLGPERNEDHHPLAPWHKIGASAWVHVENLGGDSLPVSVRAPEVDDAVRSIGWAQPGHSLLRLPYGDTQVWVIVGADSTRIKVDRPKTYDVRVAP